MAGKRRPRKEALPNVEENRLAKPFLDHQSAQVDSELLRESEEKFRILTEMSAAAIFFHQGKKFIYANPAAEKITGYSHDEILNLDFWELMAPEYREKVKGRGLARLSGDNRTPRYEVKIITKQGLERWLDLSSARMEYQGKTAIMATALDITERKRAEEAAMNSDIRFRSLIQNASDIIRILDKEGRIIFDSPSSEKTLGYPPGYMLGKSPFDFIHPDDLKLVREEIGTVYEKRNTGIPVEFRIRKAGGEYLWVESTGVNMIGVPGVDGIVITTRPVGERKKAEEELKAAKQQAELYLDLMSHDITNMNQVGMGFLELALSSLELDETDREMLLKPMQAFVGSTRLINNVRKLQKARAGEYKDKEMDLGQVLTDTRSHYTDLSGRDIAINYVPDAGYTVVANELLYDLFSNLVGNSIKHSSGNIIIDIKVKRSRENDRDYYMVAIEDNGHGIKDDLKPVIFDRKLRGDVRSKGSGIGLFLVKTLVESYHGKVWVEDRVRGDHTKGARFMVMLPAIEK